MPTSKVLHAFTSVESGVVPDGSYRNNGLYQPSRWDAHPVPQLGFPTNRMGLHRVVSQCEVYFSAKLFAVGSNYWRFMCQKLYQKDLFQIKTQSELEVCWLTWPGCRHSDLAKSHLNFASGTMALISSTYTALVVPL